MTDSDVATLRAFNRAYTLELGLLDTHLDGSPFTLSEARVLYELAHRESPTAADIARALHLDRAQMSRTLKRFAARGLTEARDNPAHGRQQLLSLTAEGRSVFAGLNASTQQRIAMMLEDLGPIRRQKLIDAARAITEVFHPEPSGAVILRGMQSGDLGMIVHRQMLLYGAEFGYDDSYETLIARILAEFLEAFDPQRDDAWIADLNGRIAGSVFLTADDQPDTARLRLLYVEPEARGTGLGRRLVETCVGKARALGYRRIVLWTDGQLKAARKLYERAGFTRLEAKPARYFGQEIVSETWAMDI
ncbi:bifunctional helix-turn-helix transcriptional regulator/GNAT family N-acetyltransferase [Novosphingobium rosa]|uniref:bifunctional helix-turn-helix transcriptional regulator/GNAT family N-acetyltransferase n=1 Tax=Novosphingobium rosa TaxID=76978 RepID=UPI00082D18FD|nr:helix-turn-helix domain-containing GNAT family N-acetyltransferase [Novosphingobium rosa]